MWVTKGVNRTSNEYLLQKTLHVNYFQTDVMPTKLTRLSLSMAFVDQQPKHLGTKKGGLLIKQIQNITFR